MPPPSPSVDPLPCFIEWSVDPLPCFTEWEDRPLAVVWTLAQAELVLMKCPLIHLLLCISVPRARYCSSVAEAAEFYNSE